MNRSVLAAWGTSPAHVEDWREKAACLEYDPELWWPIGTTGPAVSQIQLAVTVCSRCEVRSDCLAYALDNSITEGVWGGLSEEDRRSHKRRTDRVRREAERAEQDQAPPPVQRQASAEARKQARALVPAEDTLYVITTCREAGKPWRDIGQLLGTSDGTLREIYAGTRFNVARATEETARSIAQSVGA